MGGFFGNYLSPALTTTTQAVGAYQGAEADLADKEKKERLQQALLLRQHHQDELKDAITASTLRGHGYVPDAERGPDQRTIMSGQNIDGLVNAATGGIGNAGVQHPDASAHRYGASTGGFSYDQQSPDAQLKHAQIGLALARAGRMNAMTPSPAMRQALIDAGNDPEDVDAALATGNQGTIRQLLKPDPTETHAANRDYNLAHPYPSRARTSSTGETPAHRDARQGLTAVRGQINDTNAQLRTMDKSAPPLAQFPGVVSGTAADSAQARDFTKRRTGLQQRADSLGGVRDRLAGEMTGNASTSTGGADQQAHYDDEAQKYKAAVSAISQRFTGTERSQRLKLAQDRYEARVRAIASGQGP